MHAYLATRCNVDHVFGDCLRALTALDNSLSVPGEMFAKAAKSTSQLRQCSVHDLDNTHHTPCTSASPCVGPATLIRVNFFLYFDIGRVNGGTRDPVRHVRSSAGAPIRATASHDA
jgi:hypothetical protein